MIGDGGENVWFSFLLVFQNLCDWRARLCRGQRSPLTRTRSAREQVAGALLRQNFNIVNFRPDKSVEEIETIQRLRELM
jgi:hypothetical protein